MIQCFSVCTEALISKIGLKFVNVISLKKYWRY
jgi:hypothetical protein